MPGWTFSNDILDQVGTFQIPCLDLDKSRTLKISSRRLASARWTFGIHPAQRTGLPLKFFHQIVYVSRTDSQNSQLISRRRFFVSNLIGITGQILIWSCSGNNNDGLVITEFGFSVPRSFIQGVQFGNALFYRASVASFLVLGIFLHHSYSGKIGTFWYLE